MTAPVRKSSCCWPFNQCQRKPKVKNIDGKINAAVKDALVASPAGTYTPEGFKVGQYPSAAVEWRAMPLSNNLEKEIVPK
jgi:hypothetical protein